MTMTSSFFLGTRISPPVFSNSALGVDAGGCKSDTSPTPETFPGYFGNRRDSLVRTSANATTVRQTRVERPPRNRLISTPISAIIVQAVSTAIPEIILAQPGDQIVVGRHAFADALFQQLQLAG